MFNHSSITYFNSGIVLKLLKLHILPYNMKINLSTNKKTYYDILKISPNATHNEIKSAYYKLTLQYHPDKNKSESAKQIFQDISSAYEVLGNYQSRKKYDRSIAIKFKDINKTHRPQTMTHDYTTSSNRVYNIDKWTQAHYQSNFEANLERKNMYDMYVKQQDNISIDKNDRSTWYIIIVICTVFFSFFKVRLKQSNFDEPIQEKKD